MDCQFLFRHFFPFFLSFKLGLAAEHCASLADPPTRKFRPYQTEPRFNFLWVYNF